ncbi:MAG: tryptophan-rich sensory protein [Pirellulaceae bacterium]|nr:tryptophan-rich sensory protein [Pirellulaceae bacterium]
MPDAKPKRPWIGLILFIGLCFFAAWLGSAATTPKIVGWYASLIKPGWNPPNWIFGPVWTVLFLAMAVAAWLVWRKTGWSGAQWPLSLFGLQLALNVSWSWLFFGMESPALAFAEILLLWTAITATMVAFWPRSKAAGLLFVPYLAWITFAAVLNFVIWRLN